MVTADELAQIQERMAEAGITNAGAYMRKMALNGYILHISFEDKRKAADGLISSISATSDYVKIEWKI